MAKADAVTSGKAVEAESDFEAHKLDAESNLGMQMLQKAGWKEGQGLGADGKGVTAPINMNNNKTEAAG